MAVHLRDGFYATCTSPISGTGAYTGLTTPAGAGWRSYASLADGDEVEIAVRSDAGWGEDVLATKGGGATPTLTRTQVLSNSNGNTSPISWTNGTPLVITSTVSGTDIASLLRPNTYQAHQFFNGKRVALTTDGNTYLQSTTNTQIGLTLNATFIGSWQFGSSGEPQYNLTWSDSGALAGPGIVLDRNSSTPAHFDQIGYVNFSGRNDAGTTITYAQILGYPDVVSGGSESAVLDFNMKRAGSTVMAFEIGHDLSAFYPTLHGAGQGVLVGKTIQGLNLQGAEILANGIGAFTSQDSACLLLNRKGSDTNMIEFSRDGATVGIVSVSGGTMTYGPFMGSHLSWWHASVDDPARWEKRGTVVCTADGVLPGFGGRLPLVAPSLHAGDKRVYGVFNTLLEVDGVHYVQTAGVGAGVILVTGAVEAGDFLESSDVPGAARAQENPYRTNATVAKATQDSPDDGAVRLVACTYEAG